MKAAGTATVTIASLDPDILEFTAGAEQTLQVAAGGSIEARFDAAGKRVGRARVRMSVKIGDETDAFEDVIPVEVLVSNGDRRLKPGFFAKGVVATKLDDNVAALDDDAVVQRTQLHNDFLNWLINKEN